MDLSSPISKVPFVGPLYAKRLEKLDISTVKDLLFHLPARYQDYSLVSNIFGLQEGETVTIQGKIESTKNIYTRGGRQIQEAIISDSTGQIKAIWFNQRFLVQSLKPGSKLSLSGKVTNWNHAPSLISPDYEQINPDRKLIHTARLVPIYHETQGITSKWLRSRIASLLTDQIPPDPLPPEIILKENFMSLSIALKAAHFPENEHDIMEAKRRLAFDELFALSLISEIRKKSWRKAKISHRLSIDKSQINEFISRLPFSLTPDQTKASDEILTDMNWDTAMNRLLLGDVGSGKTVVAAIAALAAHLNEKKTLFMAPTQILATQHYDTLTALLEPMGVKTRIVTSDSKKKMPHGSANLIVGTHALLHQKDLENDPDIALVIIDEQHRFGVEQRAHFLKNRAMVPHMLTMTATPIPRTVALTLYGDLDLSQIKTLPRGRKRIITWVVPPDKRQAAYGWISKQLKQKSTSGQAFIVCPFIEPSESQTSVKAATAEFENLKKSIFPDLKLALLHGKMRPNHKSEIMAAVKSGEYDILVATPVVEVGIDIPNATIILIEDADKFGLAQLHQLRGRVGRGDKQSYCLLFSQSDKSLFRLKHMETIHSGIELAELDLKIRGPGDVYGTSQHGFNQLKIASYSDTELIEKSRSWAEKVSNSIEKYPSLQEVTQSAKIPRVEPN